MGFSRSEIADEIKEGIPKFEITYVPDFSQDIADSWPHSIDNSRARNDWGLKAKFDLEKMTEDILRNLSVSSQSTEELL